MSFNGLEENNKIKEEMQSVIDALKEKGITHNSKEHEIVGLGDVVESTLQTFGITEERFKKWFNLKECNCKERKKYLNNLFSWRKK
jgi:hypothetical protein